MESVCIICQERPRKLAGFYCSKECYEIHVARNKKLQAEADARKLK